MTLQATTLNALIYDVARSLVHHGFNRLIFVNGHTSNMKVVDPTMRRLRYETGALIAIFKCYGERYLDLIADVLENPPEETPGWHGSEEETSIMLAYDEEVVHMDLAVQGQTHAPDWMPEAFAKTDGTWDVQFKGYEYFYFPMDHDEFADDGVIGNPMRATKRKGEEIFRRFAEHLAEGVVELRKAPVSIRSRQFEGKA